MNNILVTGAKGQLGKEIQKISTHYNKFKFFFTDIEELDITNHSKVLSFFKQNEINFIINCAAYTDVDKAETENQKAKNINILGAKNLKESAEYFSIPIIHISTDYVFDGKNFKPYIESDKTKPQGNYGKTKLEGEKIILKYNKSIVIRTSWLYSTFGNNFVKTILNISRKNPEISVVFDQVGSPTYAHDLAVAILNITGQIINKEKEKYGIFHFSNEGVCSWYDFAVAIVNFKNIESKVIPVDSEKFKRPAARPFYSVLDKSKIKKEYNLIIPHWLDSLKNCLIEL